MKNPRRRCVALVIMIAASPWAMSGCLEAPPVMPGPPAVARTAPRGHEPAEDARPGRLTIEDPEGGECWVVSDAAAVARILDELPADVRCQLLATGNYETSRPEVARSLWFLVMEEHPDKSETPRPDIRRTTWGRIKVRYG